MEALASSPRALFSCTSTSPTSSVAKWASSATRPAAGRVRAAAAEPAGEGKPAAAPAAETAAPAPKKLLKKKPVYSMKKGQIVRIDKDKYLNSINYLSVGHPPFYKGLDYIYEDRGEVLDIRVFETGEYALIAWVGIPTPPAWLPTYMLIKGANAPTTRKVNPEESHGGEGCSRSARSGRGVRPPPPRPPAGVRRPPPALLLLRVSGPAPRAPAGGLGDGRRAPGDAAGGLGGPRAALLPLGLRVPPLPLGHQLLLLLARPSLPRRRFPRRLRPHPPLCCEIRDWLHHFRGGSPHLGHDFHRRRRAVVRSSVERSRDVQRRGQARPHRIHGIDSTAASLEEGGRVLAPAI